MADDLGDEWWTEGQNEVSSGSESSSDDGEELPSRKKPRLSDESVQDSLVTLNPLPNESSDDGGTDDNVESKAPKQKKKRRKRITEDLKENPPKPGAPEDLLTVIEKQFRGKLSPVEWDEMQLDIDSHFGISNTHNEAVSSYLKTILPKWNKMVKKGDKSKPECGSPLMLIISSSAIRSVELVRQVTDFRDGKGKLAKLFAKHAKLEEQQAFLKKNVVHLGIGTPNRIKKLMDNDCLHLSRTSVVVLDWNWRNVKLKSLTDIPEIRQDLMDLFKHFIFPHLRNNSCKLYLM